MERRDDWSHGSVISWRDRYDDLRDKGGKTIEESWKGESLPASPSFFSLSVEARKKIAADSMPSRLSPTLQISSPCYDET
jgi:hypothetical protein